MWNPGYLLVAEFGILGFGIENLATANRKTVNRNPVNDWNPKSTTFLNPESTLEFRIQDYNLGFPFMGWTKFLRNYSLSTVP